MAEYARIRPLPLTRVRPGRANLADTHGWYVLIGVAPSLVVRKHDIRQHRSLGAICAAYTPDEFLVGAT